MSNDRHDSVQIAYSVLGEMAVRGNHVARLYSDELSFLQSSLSKLETDSNHSERVSDLGAAGPSGFMIYDKVGETTNEWWSDDVMNGDQLNAVADLLSLDGLEWLTSGSFHEDTGTCNMYLSSTDQVY